ncbi:Polygalacturonaseprecursor [Actinidia chinensis var. chinensis]|uniref:endo-polygalacturonase n=1 Tax=Actinidia chinensis var. chinensis TaxID=1590841 RepID=A0A2R6RKB3_ACTCC|nr:Polygalacturonaseprecursor [Actinidia chinensis var. chinensis]
MANSLRTVFVFNLCALSFVQCDQFSRNTYNVFDFGAAADGSTDDTLAFEDAWKAMCWSRAASPTLYVPYGGTFLLHPVIFSGPCHSKTINVKIDGELIAPRDPSKWKCKGNKCHQWIGFVNLNGLYISGSGTINAQGTQWWASFCNHKKQGCGRKKPTGFAILYSKDVHISDLTFMDSPQMHITFERSKWVYATNLTITAPQHSPNTDGIHTQHSQYVFIAETHIATGDDCISIGDGSSYINISTITCGPGHGISIGSLGEKMKNETVEHVYVSDVDFRGTSNGARIKTWQGGRGFARNIVFERIRCFGSTHPIIIDQYYCDHQHCTNHTSAVQVSNVRYSQIYGTSREDTAVKFACSESVPCRDIFMNDINIQSADQHTSKAMSFCQNVQGRQNGEVSPGVPCLTN